VILLSNSDLRYLRAFMKHHAHAGGMQNMSSACALTACARRENWRRCGWLNCGIDIQHSHMWQCDLRRHLVLKARDAIEQNVIISTMMQVMPLASVALFQVRLWVNHT